MSNNISIGERIKSLREKEKKTQRDICDAIHVEQVTMSQYENDKRIPKLEILIAIADFYNVSLDYLVGRIKLPTSDISIHQAPVTPPLSDNTTMLLENFEKLGKEDQALILGKTIELAREQQKAANSAIPLKKVL